MKQQEAFDIRALVRQEKGSTLIEVLAAIVLIGMIFTLVFALEGSLWRTWQGQSALISSKDRALHLQQIMEQEVRKSTAISLSEDGKTLTFNRFDGMRTSVSIDDTGTVTLFDPANPDEYVMVAEKVMVEWRLISTVPDTVYLKIAPLGSEAGQFMIETELSVPLWPSSRERGGESADQANWL